MIQIHKFGFCKFCLFFILLVLTVFFSVSCGKKSKTDFVYKAPIPVEIRCSRQNDGLWKISGGVPVQGVGVFAIEQTFDTRDEYTYIVLRDRSKGTDQVFKIATKGYIELHTVGEHKIMVQRDENKVTLDVATISGFFDFKVYPDSKAVARVEFGQGQPDFVVFSDKRLGIEYQSYIWADDSLSLDSIQSITYRKSYRDRRLIFNWKADVKDNPKPFELPLGDWQNDEKNFTALQQSINQFAPNVRFEREIDSSFVSFMWVALAVGVVCTFLIGFFMNTHLTGGNLGKGFLGLGLLICFIIGDVVCIAILVLDWKFATSIFG